MIEVKENDLLFAKVKPNAIIPTKEEEDAGRDVYACFDEDYIMIPPHTTKLIPTGIASAISPKYEIRLRDRGSNGSKGIHVNAGTVDSGYRGEWFVAWCNTNDVPVVLSKLSEKELIEKYGHADGDDIFLFFDSHKEPNVSKEIIDYFYYEEGLYIAYYNQSENVDKSNPDTNLKVNAIIYPYEKAIAQAEICEVPVMTQREISYEELKQIPSKRGLGSLGSSRK